MASIVVLDTCNVCAGYSEAVLKEWLRQENVNSNLV